MTGTTMKMSCVDESPGTCSAPRGILTTLDNGVNSSGSSHCFVARSSSSLGSSCMSCWSCDGHCSVCPCNCNWICIVLDREIVVELVSCLTFSDNPKMRCSSSGSDMFPSLDSWGVWGCSSTLLVDFIFFFCLVGNLVSTFLFSGVLVVGPGLGTSSSSLR